jgi:type I restriction enzyme R subunit
LLTDSAHHISANVPQVVGIEIKKDSLLNEADTCRKYVIPRLIQAGWDTDPHSFTEQRNFTDGRIIVVGDRPKRRKQKRADYLLRFTRDFTIAVVEAKPKYRKSGEGLQQAKEYAEILGLKFAYATNGEGIVEFDYATGKERELSAFPSPEELWSRYCKAQKRTSLPGSAFFYIPQVKRFIRDSHQPLN